MKSPRTTYTLITLFFLGLVALWWLDRAGVPTEAERRQRINRVLPDLIDTPEGRIGRVEINRGGETLVFVRRGHNGWQMKRPIDVAADPAIVDGLVRSLKDLRKSPDAGTIEGPAGSYGLEPPALTVRAWEFDPPVESGATDAPPGPPIAGLEVGNRVRQLLYVRPAGERGIEVVDARLMTGLDRPLSGWREHSLVPVSTFQVAGLSIRRDDLDLTAERVGGGRWRLSRPVGFPANATKIEGFLAAITSIRVGDEAGGFVADDVTDYVPYGLDRPVATVELRTTKPSEAPLTLLVGKSPEGRKDRVYVRRKDQNDVALVDAKFLGELPRDNIAFRDQLVAEIDPARVREIRITSPVAEFHIVRGARGWDLVKPSPNKADPQLVLDLIGRLEGLKTAEFLGASRLRQAGISPPALTIRLWQDEPAPEGTPGDASKPKFSLNLGRHDLVRKTVYAQIEGDDVILALPDLLMDAMPWNRYAYRDRAVLSVDPSTIARLSVDRPGQSLVVSPDRAGGAPNRWQMLSPVKAAADIRVVTQALSKLANLRAEAFVGETSEARESYGVDQPGVTIAWEVETSPAAGKATGSSGSPTRGRLRVGKPVKGKPGTFYAEVDGFPLIFTVGTDTLQPFGAEFHDNQVLSFPAESLRHLTLRWPGRTLGLRRVQSAGTPGDWAPDLGSDVQGVDLSRIPNLVASLARLHTTRFYQYDGPMGAETGLEHPRLILELDLADGSPTRVVRIGSSYSESVTLAATGRDARGPVFFLPAPAWDDLVRWGSSPDDLPSDPFAPP